MKKTRKAHLWIGLICSIFILMESITGLVMNEPWLIGQSQIDGRGDFQQARVNQGGTSSVSSQVSGQNQGQNNSQSLTKSQNQDNNQTMNQAGNSSTGLPRGPGGDGGSSGSFMSIIKGLHEGRMGTMNIKWITDLAALALIFLTSTGIYLSIKVLNADKKRKKRKMNEVIVVDGN